MDPSFFNTSSLHDSLESYHARHHPELPNFPHHKHVGRKMVGAMEPTLSQVLKEIATLMEQEATE